MVTARNYIAGRWVVGSGQGAVQRTDPADCERLVSRSIPAGPREAVATAAAAAVARPDWEAVPLVQRCDLMRQLAQMIKAEGPTLATSITDETGKTLSEAEKEVDAALVEITAAIDAFDGNISETHGPNLLTYRPIGTTFLVTPFNFPLAAILRKLVPSLLAGNCAIVKASELTPLTSVHLFRMLDALHMPRGTVNLLLGDGAALLDAVIDSPGLAAISVTGSSATGAAIAAMIGHRNIRLQAETGGSNAVIVLADADLDKAAADVSAHAFACAGQWCTGTRRVIVELPVLGAFTERLLAHVSAIRVGPGRDPQTSMGALVTLRERDRVQGAVERFIRAGARCLVGGGRPAGLEHQRGAFLQPTVLTDITSYESVCSEEVFGPVLFLVSAGDREEALQLANVGCFGLSASIYTGDEEAGSALGARLAAGLVHINLPTGFRDPAMPLCGWRQSGRGIPESGRFGRDFFTRVQTIYRRPQQDDRRARA